MALHFDLPGHGFHGDERATFEPDAAASQRTVQWLDTHFEATR